MSTRPARGLATDTRRSGTVPRLSSAMYPAVSVRPAGVGLTVGCSIRIEPASYSCASPTDDAKGVSMAQAALKSATISRRIDSPFESPFEASPSLGSKPSSYPDLPPETHDSANFVHDRLGERGRAGGAFM